MSLQPPPVLVPPVQKSHREPPPQAKKEVKGPLGALLAFCAVAWKFILPALKLLKGAKFLLTGASMIASVWVYSIAFGWPFAAGFVLCIFVHEMGHVAMAAQQGVPVTVPIFIPGFGALILQNRWAKSAWGEALIGIGGPMAGTFAAMVCWGCYFVTGQGIFLGLAFFGFMINLFNMIPIMPLDGGWIVSAISPFLWLIGVVIMVVMASMGLIRNPLIWILVLLSLPHLWSGLKRGTADPMGGEVTTKTQKLAMGIAYLGLCGLLVVGMTATHDGLLEIRAQKRALIRNVPAH